MFIRDEFKLLFIHPPKTGGISIGTYLIKNGFCYSQKHLNNDLKKEYAKYGNHHVDNRLIPNFDYDYMFSIFRDPIERLKSGYKHRFVNDYNFKDFVDKGLEEYDRNSSKFIDQIIKPQVEYYNEKCEVFLFKHIDKIPLYLNNRGILMKGCIDHLNKSKKLDIDINQSLYKKIKDFYKEDYIFFNSLISTNT